MTHISYKCAKKLKDFLKESAPEPIGGQYYGEFATPTSRYLCKTEVPVYMLHDLLSKPFCEACAEHHPHKEDMGPLKEVAWELAVMITELFYSGGLPAVETALMEMMEAK